METKILQIRNFFFWTLLVYFVAVVIEVPSNHRIHLWGMLVIAVVLFALGAVLTVLTLKIKELLPKRIFFLMTGLSALALPIFAILHNVVYGLFFHGKAGEDEAVFFILAVIVCPAMFIIGMLGSIVLLISARLKKRLEC